jgi:glycosyltransferase involved in cell wall biosynthesis/GT2 family glycosyltransferase
MRICFVCCEYPPGPHGGIGASTQTLARALAQAGHELRVAGLYPRDYPAPDYQEDHGVHVWRLRGWPTRLGWLSDRYRLFRLVARWAKTGQLDLIDVPDYQGWAAGWSRLPVPVIARWCGSGSAIRTANDQRVPGSTSFFERASLHRCDYHCAKSAYLARQTQMVFGLPPPRAIIPNAVELPKLTASPTRLAHQVIFTGTMNANKGIVSLIRAWPYVVAAQPKAELHVFGKDGRAPQGGLMQAYLLTQLDPRLHASVHFHGHVKREEVFEHLAASRVGVFPSYSEGFANAPVEAMACGCPTIISNRSSGPEIVRHGIDGLTVNPDDPRDIADAICRLLEDDHLAQRCGESARQRVEDNFSLTRIVADNEAFFRQCLEDFARRHPLLSPSVRSAEGVANGSAADPEPSPGNSGSTRDIASSWEEAASGVQETIASHIARQAGQAVPLGELAPKGEPTDGCTVAVCTYRRAASLTRFLDSLAAGDRRPERLVIVDASPDEETEKALLARQDLDRLGESFLYFRVLEPLTGLTRQRNFALRWVATDRVAFFDDDIVLDPHCLIELEKAHRAQDADVVGVAAVIENQQQRPNGLWRLRRWLGMIGPLRPGTYCRSGLSIPWSFLPPGDALVEGQWLPGGATMWKTAVVRRLGFCENLDGYGQAEDLEFSLRAARQGKLFLAQAARATHLHEAQGRPNYFRLGYMAIFNRYQIHRQMLQDRRPRDVAWFAYAWSIDTLLLTRHLLRPHRTKATLQQIIGRIQAAVDLLGRRDRNAGQEPVARRSPKPVVVRSPETVGGEASDRTTRVERPSVMVFWDYDTQWGADRSHNPNKLRDWGFLEFENTERLLELHAQYQVPACFAVVGAAALPGERPYHDPAQIRRIHAAGHEVGSHSFHHDWLPALDRNALRATLRESKDALEQCLGVAVQTFVPPWNQPFDYPAGWSFSLSERRCGGPERTDLGRLCASLYETGYRFCRVAYRPLWQRLAESVRGRRLDRPSRREKIAGVTCVRLNSSGFDAHTLDLLEHVTRDGGILVAYGHPHSLRAGNSQDESRLVPFLQRVQQLQRQGAIAVRQPRDILQEEPTTAMCAMPLNLLNPEP